MKKAPPGNLSTAAGRRGAPAHDRLRERAEDLAVKALVFLASDAERMGRFAEISGLGPQDLRAAAESPDFLAGVLDYLASDESLLLAFAANAGIDPVEIGRTLAALSQLPEA